MWSKVFLLALSVELILEQPLYSVIWCSFFGLYLFAVRAGILTAELVSYHLGDGLGRWLV